MTFVTKNKDIVTKNRTDIFSLANESDTYIYLCEYINVTTIMIGRAA